MLTREQTKEIQAKLGIETDGHFGDQTKAAVYKALIGISSVGASSVVVPPTPARWPLQSECGAFYGNPVGSDGTASLKWQQQNLVKVTLPWKCDAGIPISKITIHRKCAESAQRILNVTWDKIGRDQKIADGLGLNWFSGSYNFRPIRNGQRLSMHAYGCAWDWDYPNNMMGDKTPKFGFEHPFVVAHLDEGWIWGADWDGDHEILDSSPIDGMHFQAARVH